MGWLRWRLRRLIYPRDAKKAEKWRRDDIYAHIYMRGLKLTTKKTVVDIQ